VKKAVFSFSAILILFFQSGLQAQLPHGIVVESSRVADMLTGGSLTASSANTLGGWGHFSLGGVVSVSRPRLPGTIVTASSVSALFRIGVFEGMRLGPGVHGVGSVDLYLRTGRLIAEGVNSENTALLGGGIRVGILRNSILTPAVSLSVGYHSSGKMPLSNVLGYQLLPFGELEFSSLALRIDLSKNLFRFTPMAGVGVNRNRIRQLLVGSELEVRETEAVYYGGVEWNFLLFRLGIELGSTGGDSFGSLGARFAL